MFPIPTSSERMKMMLGFADAAPSWPQRTPSRAIRKRIELFMWSMGLSVTLRRRRWRGGFGQKFFKMSNGFGVACVAGKIRELTWIGVVVVEFRAETIAHLKKLLTETT